FGPPASVLVNSDQSRYTTTVDEFASNHWPESFRSDHHNIDIFSRNDGAVINREAVSKEKRLAGPQIRGDLLLIDRRHLCVGQREKDNVAASHRLRGLENFEAISFRTNARFAARIKADHNLHSAIAQIKRVRMSLCAKADDGAGFPFQPRKIDIFVTVNAHRHTPRSSTQVPPITAPRQT